MTDAKQRPRAGLEVLISFVAGMLFAIGLALAGMTQPSKVVGFLDVAGHWDPSLAFVMLGAIAVYAVANRLVKGRAAPLVGGSFHLPTRRDIDPNLMLGAGLFGIGWGLAGYCPGPGLTSVATGSKAPLTFVVAMSIGMLTFAALQKFRRPRVTRAAETSREPSQHGA